MRVLAVIPARGGSRRIHGKNLADLGGRPLIDWTIECALATCSAVMVSTDNRAIAEHAKSLRVGVILRPPELAENETPMKPVIDHVARYAEGRIDFDAIAVLQPTSPFRSPEDMHHVVEIMDRTGADSVISVVPVTDEDAFFTVGFADRLHPATGSQVHTPNGAIYLLRRELIESGEGWYGIAAYAYVMPAERSLDIDTHTDMDAARALVAQLAVPA